jgi:hypothetical protein
MPLKKPGHALTFERNMSLNSPCASLSEIQKEKITCMALKQQISSKTPPNLSKITIHSEEGH